MKTVLSIVLFTGLTSLVSADPFIVYTGTSTSSNITAAGTAKSTTAFYLITDLADTSKFAFAQADTSSKIYTSISIPTASPTADEANNNFFGGITASNGKSGAGVFSFDQTSTDSSNKTYVTHLYATGALTLKSTVLVPARAKALTVSLKNNGLANGTFTFNPSAAVLSGNVTFPMSLTGTFFSYEIAADGTMPSVGSPAAITLKEDPALTLLANIGGPLTVGKSVFAVESFDANFAEDSSITHEGWLDLVLGDEGYSVPQVSSSSGSEGDGGGTLTVNGSGGGSSGITVITGVGLGTVGGVTFTGGSGGGTLTLGGTTTTSGGTLQLNGGSGGSSLTRSGSGTWVLGGSNTFSGSTTISGGVLSGSTGGTISSTGGGAVLLINTGTSTGTPTISNSTSAGNVIFTFNGVTTWATTPIGTGTLAPISTGTTP